MNNFYPNMPFMPGRPPFIDMAAQQTQYYGIKGRPVSSYDEARASMIDFDGSIFYFPDTANERIYTKQINLDGTASLKVYVLSNQQQAPPHQDTPVRIKGNVSYEEFEKTIQSLVEEIQKMKGASSNEQQSTAATNVDAIKQF